LESLFYAFYQNTAGQGVTGLTGTVDVYKVAKVSPYMATQIVTGGAATAIGNGLYYLGVTGTDPTNFDYPAVFKTTGSVSSQWIPSIRWDDGSLTGDAMALTPAERTTVSTSVWNSATRTLTSGIPTVSDIDTQLSSTHGAGSWLTGGGGGATAADVWSYVYRTLTQTPQQIIQNSVYNSDINVYKSTTFNVALQGMSDFTGWQEMWFTVKDDISFETPDSESIIQLQLTSTGSANDGLLWINKEVATATDGYLAVSGTSSVFIKVKASVTGDLPPKTLYYGIKYLDADGDVIPLSEGGKFVINHSTSKKVS
jgi:hypothetical protein